MRVLVTGGTGFVGSALLPYLVEQGHTVRLLVRPVERKRPALQGVEIVEGHPMQEGPWWKALDGCEAAVNLAGAPIFRRWNPRAKALIRDSRIATTRNLVNALKGRRGFTLVSTSAVGIYGNAGERELDESAPAGTDFLARLAADWEAEALKARSEGVRVVVTRFAIVLGQGGGALEKLALATRLFLGGPIASGRQWFSWIHREDLVRAVLFALESPGLEGPVNLSAPNPVRQAELARTLGKVLQRPALLWAPALAVRLVLGEFADTVLFSQRMVPRRLREAGFAFRYPELEQALRDILKRS
ncbi:MAG: TIGR01777 family protein [Deltaproteobacteria bacterium]|nr:TIGR01777 family protein [Deltaproteobacteria bacterium]